MSIPPRTINQWLVHTVPGLNDQVMDMLKQIPGSIVKRGPVNNLPEHLKEKLPKEYNGVLPNTFIAFNLELPLPIPSDGLEDFLTRTYHELSENALREFVNRDKDLRDRGEPPFSENVLSIDAKLKTDDPQGGPKYSIQILDNGRGMSKTLVQYILDHISSQRGKPYQLPLNYRCEESGKLIGGYGIVMAVNYVLRLKGAFSVRAIEGKGTKIRFDLPIEGFHNIRKYFPPME